MENIEFFLLFVCVCVCVCVCETARARAHTHRIVIELYEDSVLTGCYAVLTGK
jgi:hypothetical protein